MRPRRSIYFLAVFLLPGLVLLQDPRIKESVHGFSLGLLKPLFQLGSAMSSGVVEGRDSVERFWQSFRSQADTEGHIAELEAELLRFEELSKENERLRKLLEFRDTLSGNRIAARVIGWDPSPWRKTVILDKGMRDGIRKDMAVLVNEGLVGRILEAGPGTSRAILLIDTDSRVSAMASESRAQGMVAGGSSSELSMEYLELESGVAVGETVTTSGMSGIFPKGIRIGKVISLTRDNTGLHLKARVESSVRFSKLEEVLCLASSPAK